MRHEHTTTTTLLCDIVFCRSRLSTQNDIQTSKKKLNGFYFSFMLIIKNFSFLRHSNTLLGSVVCIMHAKIDNVKTFYIFHVHAKSLCSHSIQFVISLCSHLCLSLVALRPYEIVQYAVHAVSFRDGSKTISFSYPL